MSRFIRTVLPAALLLALAVVPAGAHEGNPDYRSEVRAIEPATEGLTAKVLDHDDALLVVNGSDRTVVILNEEGEPYARLLADGTVQVDRAASSPEAEQRDADDGASAARPGAGERLYASVDGPLLAHAGHHHEDEQSAGRGAAAQPRWTTLDRTGRYQWHDVRIRYSGAGVPPQVTDPDDETKVRDWRVPIVVGGERGAILGTLTWVGEAGGGGSSFPTAAVVSLAAIALLAVGAVALVRRRRAGAGTR